MMQTEDYVEVSVRVQAIAPHQRKFEPIIGRCAWGSFHANTFTALDRLVLALDRSRLQPTDDLRFQTTCFRMPFEGCLADVTVLLQRKAEAHPASFNFKLPESAGGMGASDAVLRQLADELLNGLGV